MRRWWLGIVLALAVAGCTGTSDDPGDASPSVETPPSSGPAGVPSPPPTLPPVLPSETPAALELTLTGEVVEGVEVNCRLLQTDAGEYLLIGEAAQEVPLGETVTIRGRPRPGLATTCQQGTPLEVTEVLE